jgi:hypothetical protein
MGQTTVPRLLALLHSLGIVISKRQLVSLLTADHDSFVNEARGARQPKAAREARRVLPSLKWRSNMTS